MTTNFMQLAPRASSWVTKQFSQVSSHGSGGYDVAPFCRLCYLMSKMADVSDKEFCIKKWH